MKDAVATMGNVLPDDAGGRDAVHVAVFSAVSDEPVVPGEDIIILAESTGTSDTKVCPAKKAFFKKVAIVDPFIQGTIPAGKRFWAFLYPRTITALAHRWSHPAFEESTTTYATPATRLESEEWLRNFCDNNDCPNYDLVMKAVGLVANNVQDYSGEESYTKEHNYTPGIVYNGEDVTFYGNDAHCAVPDEFWRHAEIVLGQPIIGRKPSYFSCTC